jgi:hypothetical protein
MKLVLQNHPYCDRKGDTKRNRDFTKEVKQSRYRPGVAQRVSGS